jgi:membrane associated rhomboid family serine protease
MAVPPGPSTEPGVSSSAPTCFRHPDRETYVSCVRCGRPACPDCLRSAAVGQQCVECIRNANRGSRVAAAPFGGRTVNRPIATWTLVAINVIAYFGELAKTDWIISHGAMVGRYSATIGVADGQWYRLLTSAFLHEPPGSGVGLLHIAFNMWALIVVGPALERMLGRLRFVAVYLVSALGGAVLFYLLAPPHEIALGASGAIFGLFGAWFVLARRLRLDARAVVGLIVINLVITFAVSGIAWQAHVGGLIAGAALTAAYAYAPRANRTLVQAGATVAIVALLVVAVLVRDHALARTTAGIIPPPPSATAQLPAAQAGGSQRAGG